MPPASVTPPAEAAAPLPGHAPAPAPPPGLRERKKQRTRRAIRQSAYRLFAEQGYDATHVDQIAEAAEVSPSTVFRYFPTKEDIVLTDESDALMRAALLARPADEPPVTALRHAVQDVLAAAYGSAPDEAALRLRLAAGVPAVRARLTQSVSETGCALARALAERSGRTPDDLELQVCAGAMMGGLVQALLHWAESGKGAPGGQAPGEQPSAVIERALDVLERGLTL